jgi:ERCC4-type nuclease
MKDLSPVIVAADEDRRHQTTTQLIALNTPSVASPNLPFDYMWTVDGEVVAGERKSIEDFIASYSDERLHHQLKAMTDRQAKLKFILLEGKRSHDGSLVGDRRNWTWNQFDNALVSIQMEGVVLVTSHSAGTTPMRLSALWRWTGKEGAPSWHAPTSVMPENDLAAGVIFFDDTYRKQVGCLMHLPDVGLKTAAAIRESMSFMDAFGITEEGLEEQKKRLKAIKGIGPKTIAGIERFIKCEAPPWRPTPPS